MIDFDNGTIFKLTHSDGFTSEKMVSPLFAP